MFGAYRCQETTGRVWEQLRDWYRTPLGERVSEQERDLLANVLPNLFGYYLLQVGMPVETDLLSSSRISRRFVIDSASTTIRAPGAERCVGEPHQLPIQSDSVDVVLLPHTLEFSSEPHSVLRETERMLIAEGHVVILGFNPWSFWGVRQLFGRRSGLPPWCGQFLSPTRVRDWLALLGFGTVLARGFLYRPPLQQQRLMERLRFMEQLGARGPYLPAGGYVLVAKKRVATLTPLRRRWRPRRSLVASGLAKPTLNTNRF